MEGKGGGDIGVGGGQWRVMVGLGVENRDRVRCRKGKGGKT